MEDTMKLITVNPYSNAGQATVNGFYNNLSYDPTVEELNRSITRSDEVAQPAKREESDPPFGTHIREAVWIVRDWAKSR